LINATVDPDEVVARLPAGVRPHVTDSGTVVGCCLLELTDVRPMPLPATVGVRLRAVAHRISVEWTDDAGDTITGVYVPVRLTDSRAASVLGGRAVPGVHRRAALDISTVGDGCRWRVEDATRQFDLDVSITRVTDLSAGPIDVVGSTCLGADFGLSPRRRGGFDVVRMNPASRDARPIQVDGLASTYLDGFRSLHPATSYVMDDVDVVWTPSHNGPAPG
jgi:hypothetical protein